MRAAGASADALAGLVGRLEESLGSDAGAVGGDLFAVASVLRTEPGLRRVATDVSVATEAKAGLIDQVFGSRLTAAALTVVKDAVGRRWTASRDLADAVEHLGVIAVVRSAGKDARRLSDELFGLGQVVKDHPDLRDSLSDPARSAEDKRGLLRSLLDGKALPATITLAEQALAGSYRTVGVALAAFQKVAADVQGERVATVRVAQALSEADRDRLAQALASQYDRPVHLNVVVDASVIGGIRVEIGDDVIDGTVSARLADAQRRLAG